MQLRKDKFFLFLGVSAVLHFFSLALPFIVQANQDFDVSLHSTYNVNSNGITFIQQKFELTNKQPTTFAKQYSLEVNSTRLRNIRALNEKGSEIPSDVATTPTKTSITLNFPDQLVGEGKKRNFTIQFENPDTAIISGSILEVSIPKLLNPQDYTQYDVTLHVPSQFGKPVRMSPLQTSLTSDSSLLTLEFTKVGSQSISALFGQKQNFDFALKYNLENSTGNTGIMQIALPPDTQQQKVFYQSLDPPPKEMTRDADGNWIATYEIAAEKNLDVNLTGKASIFLDFLDNPQTEVPHTDLTKAQSYWESNDVRIQQLAKQYHTPKDIYDYVVTHLKYNYDITTVTSNRLGAIGALNAPSNANCQEFTDLFIAIARAAGIPARRVTGFAYTVNSRLRPLSLIEDVLHAWPEYYDQSTQRWVPVDPTWGNTTGGINYFDQFDFNHFVFAMNGTSSTTPFAAGSYKRSNENTKDVDVKFGSEAPPIPLDLSLQFIKVPSLLWPYQENYQMVIVNKTGQAWYNLPIQLTTDEDNVEVIHAPDKVDYLLPFQTKTLTFSIKTHKPISNIAFHLTAKIGSLSSSHDLTAGFIFTEIIENPIAPIILVGCVVIIALIAGSILVSRRKR